MQRLFTVFHLLFALLFAVAGIWLLVDPARLLGSLPVDARGAVMAGQQAGFGMLLAAGVSLFCALRENSRAILYPLLCLWLPLALYLLPLLTLLPMKMPAGPLKAGELQGEVKWFNPNKGYGFILSDDGREIFVHFRAVRNGDRRTLKQGQKVRFGLRQSERGDQADDVRILD